MSRIEERSSANPRQLLAEQHVDDPRAADTRFHQHHFGVIAEILRDSSVTPERMFAHLPQSAAESDATIAKVYPR